MQRVWRGCCLAVGALAALTATEDSASNALGPSLTPVVHSSDQGEQTWPAGPTLLRWIPEKAPTPRLFRDGEVAFFIGARLLEGSVYQQLEAATQAGVGFTLGPRRWGVRPYLGLEYARASGAYKRPAAANSLIGGYYQEPDERGDMSASFLEGDIGAVYEWSLGPVHHHFGGGVCLVRASIQETPQKTIYLSLMQRDVTPRQDTDSNVGWWISTSLTTQLAGVLVGVEGRLTDSRVTLFNQPVQAGGLQVGATALWVW